MSMEFKNKKIAILGFGIEGKSLCDYLQDRAQKIVVLDEKNRADFDSKVIESYVGRGIEFLWGKYGNLKGFDIVFRSPSILPDSKVLSQAQKDGSQISSLTKLFFDLCPSEIIGVTGTKGKGTTSTLIYEMLKEAGEDVYLGGNIGNSPLDFLDSLDVDSKVVLELSSFQLIDMEKSPHIGVMLMTTSEHLDYHKDVYEYINAKRNIFRFQKETDFAVLNQDYPASNESDVEGDGKVYKVSRENKVFSEGCFVIKDDLVLKINDTEKTIMKIDEVALPGKHNLENAAAASMAAVLAGVDLPTIKHVLKTFKGLPHRIEFVAIIRGASYYDDSFSTTPETAIAAIEAFSEPKIIILGGSGKNSDFTELCEVINNSDSIRAIIGIGDEWSRIRDMIHNEKIEIVEGCTDMFEVAKEASKVTEIGDVVLLSPACASFGMFKDYKDRGEKFKEAVFQLTN